MNSSSLQTPQSKDLKNAKQANSSSWRQLSPLTQPTTAAMTCALPIYHFCLAPKMHAERAISFIFLKWRVTSFGAVFVFARWQMVLCSSQNEQIKFAIPQFLQPKNKTSSQILSGATVCWCHPKGIDKQAHNDTSCSFCASCCHIRVRLMALHARFSQISHVKLWPERQTLTCC